MPYATTGALIYVNMGEPGRRRHGTTAPLWRAMALGIDVDVPDGSCTTRRCRRADRRARHLGLRRAVRAAALRPRRGGAAGPFLWLNKRDGQGSACAPTAPTTVTLTIFTGNVWREIQTLLG